MNIFYSCYGGAHSSIVAANLHLGFLPRNRIATVKEIISAQYYDLANNEDIGTPIYMGTDVMGNTIYAIGMASSRNEFTNVIYSFVNYKLIGCRKKIFIINTLPLINIPIRIGGFMSRQLKLIAIGRPLTALGIQIKYPHFIQLVENLKQDLDYKLK